MESPKKKSSLLDDLEKEDSQKKGSSGPFLFIIILLVLVIIALSAWIWYIQTDKKKMAEQKEIKAKAVAEVPGNEALPREALLFNFEPFFVPLAGSSDEKRFLKIRMTAELSSPALVVEIKERLLPLRRSLYTLINSKRIDEIDNLKGRVRLKKDIAEKMNILLKTGLVKEIYFSEFIIQ